LLNRNFEETEMFDFIRLAQTAGRRFMAAYRNAAARRAMRPLMSMDDRMLRDIGLTRGDVVGCFSSSLPGDSFGLLIARREERRAARRPDYSDRPVYSHLVGQSAEAGEDGETPDAGARPRLAA
jgi:uncharacterized protein YjiS (DUF1127 family)